MHFYNTIAALFALMIAVQGGTWVRDHILLFTGDISLTTGQNCDEPDQICWNGQDGVPCLDVSRYRDHTHTHIIYTYQSHTQTSPCGKQGRGCIPFSTDNDPDFDAAYCGGR